MQLKKKDSRISRRAAFSGQIGIRGKLQIYLTILVAFIIALIWICQVTLLFSFFQSYRTNQVHTAGETIIRNIDHDDLEALADRLSAENEICMLLVDAEGNKILSIDHVRFCVLHHLRQNELNRLIARATPDGEESVEMMSVAPFRNDNYHKEEFEGAVPEEEPQRGRSMMYVRRVHFDDGTTGTLLINAQITPTRTIMNMLRRQLIYIIVLVLIASVLIGGFMANSVSQPIIETNREARGLSRGEYSRPEHSRGYREISELNDTLVKAADDLHKVDNLQRELIANISHDLRTPLTMIQGYAETMRDIPDEMNPENMQIIIDETNRLSSLVNEVMDFSRLRAGSMQMEKRDFDLTEKVKDICDRVSAMTEKDGYTVLLMESGTRIVHGDSKRIEQVVYNLLGNALTYTGENKQVIVKEEDRGENVRVSISDSGRGIDPAELPYIWDRYYRTQESHRRAVIGSGLGLNICRGILENHGAPYGVDSTVGVGTTFWFELPKA